MPIQPEYNILVVEDDPRHASLINRAFETEVNYKLVITATLEQARSLINQTNPDLIITDVCLPDGQGTELLVSGADCPTIVMSSQSDENVAVNAMKSGAAEYIVKTQESMSSLPRSSR